MTDGTVGPFPINKLSCLLHFHEVHINEKELEVRKRK